MFDAIAAMIETQKGHLSELDGVIGDADHGVTMGIGFSAVTEALSQLDASSAEPTAVFNAAAKSFLNAVGASSGPLYATAFMRAGAAAKGKASLDRDAMVDVVAALSRGIQERGKATRGEKTMVDAWLPGAEAAEAARAAGEPLGACLAAAAAAAKEGADSTKAMLASKGRASRLGERALGHMDPGAASAAMILQVIAEEFKD
ncbi:dihydroxyacetone kinase subunit DhaL [Aurantimonas sp. Leaf443]|uniref:dihydroxyacetone kinase subunit DhaL n=1 Tax=Aurantimonas sp. Leaf443 TaxID=1736378 RepID=UPI0006F8990E|nr:dihydroxyacetone kinase subunit DhaL [Aurantimonas sp. Leaf443]KQT86161.1 dihydroxyacetone kinase [Aurantimonas sp. Leaf443]